MSARTRSALGRKINATKSHTQTVAIEIDSLLERGAGGKVGVKHGKRTIQLLWPDNHRPEKASGGPGYEANDESEILLYAFFPVKHRAYVAVCVCVCREREGKGRLRYSRSCSRDFFSALRRRSYEGRCVSLRIMIAIGNPMHCALCTVNRGGFVLFGFLLSLPIPNNTQTHTHTLKHKSPQESENNEQCSAKTSARAR